MADLERVVSEIDVDNIITPEVHGPSQAPLRLCWRVTIFLAPRDCVFLGHTSRGILSVTFAYTLLQALLVGLTRPEPVSPHFTGENREHLSQSLSLASRRARRSSGSSNVHPYDQPEERR